MPYSLRTKTPPRAGHPLLQVFFHLVRFSCAMFFRATSSTLWWRATALASAGVYAGYSGRQHLAWADKAPDKTTAGQPIDAGFFFSLSLLFRVMHTYPVQILSSLRIFLRLGLYWAGSHAARPTKSFL